MLYKPACELMDTDCKDKVLVQGIVDLVVEGEQNILVDYKNTKLTPESAKSRYISQINTYAIAVEELMGIKLDRKVLYLINQNVFVEL
ncbi:MAG: PD-(D/E)XK nuclease family protein [Bacillota bacterium]